MNDSEMMGNPDKWPLWPFLPVKRRSNTVEAKDLGFLIDDGVSLIVYISYLPSGPIDLDQVMQLVYPNKEAMLKDGWKVD